MKLVFCGTPRFAVPTLEALVRAGHSVELVLSQPDRPVGRAGEVLPTPVKSAALALAIPVEQPAAIRTNEALREKLEGIAPAAIVVVAYGRILPRWMLDLPRHGCLNGHASLLPRWRGAAPIQWAVASGDRETGVTTMRLNEGLDTGPMLLRAAVPIGPETTSPELFERLAVIGAELMVKTLHGLADGSVVAVDQDDAAATAAPVLTREDARIDWNRSAAEIDCRFRGFQPWPGAFTTLRGKKLIVHGLRLVQGVALTPAAVEIRSGEVTVGCGDASLVALTELQMEGRKRMAAGEFLRGMQMVDGERLG